MKEKDSLFNEIARKIIARQRYDGEPFDEKFICDTHTICVSGKIMISTTIDHDDGHLVTDYAYCDLSFMSIDGKECDQTDIMDMEIKIQDILIEDK